jgi:phosphorylcholine metabolism protein LicD
MDTRKVANLAKLLFHLVVTRHAFKALDISADDTEETAMIFLAILTCNILDYFEDPTQAKTLFATHGSKDAAPSKENQDEAIWSSLLVFFLETLKTSPKNKKGSRFRKNFKAVVKEMDTDGFGKCSNVFLSFIFFTPFHLHPF